MAQKTRFKDALDYIFIANDSGTNSYLISNDIARSKVTSAITTAAANAVTSATTTFADAIMMNDNNYDYNNNNNNINNNINNNNNNGPNNVITDMSNALITESIYNGVAVELGAMLLNDTGLYLDENVTSIFETSTNASDLILNGTSIGNSTATDDDIGELIRMAVTSIILGLMILVTIVGNVFVIAAIILERNLQNVANYLVASLAVADLFVACLVMPLGAVYEISQGWILGPELCDIWTSCDVLCCTASILHLVAIAVDRYWAVTNIDYIHSRTSRRVFLMIFCVWSAAVIVSLAPQFGWKDPDYLQRIEQQKCMVSQDVAYQVFATCCTFYVPLLVILVLYWKIYQTARKRIHRRRPRPIDVTANNNQPYLSAQKPRKHLRLRIGKFSGDKANTKGGSTTLGLVEGNSTNTVNTVEDTEFSSSNVDSKSRAGIEVTTVFTNTEEIPTTSTSQISTVSHLVALANQQHAASTSTSISTSTPAASVAKSPPPSSQNHQLPSQQHCKGEANLEENDAIAEAEAATANDMASRAPTATTTPTTAKVSITLPNESNGGIGATVNGTIEVLEDPQLQQQLEQVQQQADSAITTTSTSTTISNSSTTSTIIKTAMKKSSTSVGGITGASNATTITSISAISPQTPTTIPTTTITAAPIGDATPTSHPLCSSASASNQVTPIPKTKNQQHQQQLSTISNPQQKLAKRKETLEAKRERKAAKTLAIITGAFVVCWLPFFVMALMMPLCEACEINDGVAALFLWLGYFNSTLNPVIYTIFSPEFRQAFKRILFGGHRAVHYRSGKI